MKESKRIHVIACGVLAADLDAAAKASGLELTMQFLPGGLHSRPHELRRRLQEAIDEASAARRADRIAVGYGVCGLGTVGIRARQVPLALPRVNDCIALFLGSDAAYRREFARYPGTYYIAAGWVEEKAQPQQDTARGPGLPEKERQEFDRLVERFGRDSAEAVRYFLTSWQRNYQRAAFIDTGVGGSRRKYARIARAMAEEFGWRYEELPGTGELLGKLLTAEASTEEVLIVPPHHVTAYDAVAKRLRAAPVWQGEVAPAGERSKLVIRVEGDAPSAAAGPPARIGLGIDAGGTYTDAVLMDLQADRVLQTAKALTTKWDLQVGIDEALDALDAERLRQADLVCISTTLATNAIVEGRGQKVGLLILPPYGLFDPADIAHRPIAIVDGRLEIDGTEIAPIDPDQVRRVAREMVDSQQVGAFAICGYASHNNPAHELAVQAIVRQETGLTVTCGHEVSEGLNYRVRAATAALNARIIPALTALMEKIDESLSRRGIAAAQMVVKSDGSLMSVQAARQRPIQTILSGPAASVAGACFLAKLDDAIVVDVGGTTTDTALIEGGSVRTCEDGATVGPWRTHVRALDMRTMGLGGDSHLVRERGRLFIGPRRVAPVAYLASREPRTAEALDWIDSHVDYFRPSTRGADLFCLTNRGRAAGLSAEERRLMELLAQRPHCAEELARRTGAVGWQFLPIARLEGTHAVQRCAATPTDLLHVEGRVALWDAAAAGRICDLFAKLAGQSREQFVREALRQVVRMLAVELLKAQLNGRADAEDLDRSSAARALVANLLNGGDDRLRVRVALRRPIVGIGAPVHCFLPQAAEILETQAVIPPHADVANAIGAVTSRVSIRRQVRIVPNDQGRYSIQGLPDAPSFPEFEQACRFAVDELVSAVRESASAAGTAETAVEVLIDDRIAALADGGEVFLGRRIEARLTGRPDVARAIEEMKAAGARMILADDAARESPAARKDEPCG